MFEITREDIAALNDEDLRTLIGLLCEAALRRANLPVSAATWGGDQTAKDGGLDVRVALAPGTAIEGFIPRAATGFQVKKPDMPPAEIPKEMRPKGVVRPVIEELAGAGGAYIIVSSSGSTADSALKSRRKAMSEAVKDIGDAAKLQIDFYDRNRVASWVRDHPGLIPWVRSRTGRSVPGWKGYGAWSYMPAKGDKNYLLDNKARIRTGGKDDGDGLSVVDGISRIREALQNAGQVVRLVGLSGVGKTRLAEALFDNAVGDNALDPSLAIYTDIADEPDPQPKGLASDLIAAGTRAIVVIDNCPPETHRQLSDVARALGSTISVITIEYDIREDQPEGTDVYSLDTSSLPLIEKLVAGRFPDLSQVDARRIAEFSGGNARIALGLAGTVKRAETVSGLTDTELFKRLFQQRHAHDARLLQIAEACSLVYSFQGEELTGEDAELPVLGGLVGKTAQEVFTAAAELKRRDLLQKRREWRAILPHAIANRLAAFALENIPYPVIEAAIVNGPSERLLRSFSRRLGYLDRSKEAQAIVRGWLAPDGLLSDVANLNDLGRTMFQNVAPVSPDATLSALETAFANADKGALQQGQSFVRLLHALAYDAALFERAVSLLCRFGNIDDEGSNGSVTNAVSSLFYIAFSATHAPLAIRLNVLNGLLQSKEPVKQYLGIKALEALLMSEHFRPYSSFEFGARSRDYGYHPKNGPEVAAWFEEALKAAEPFTMEGGPAMARVRSVIAQNFRGLWVRGRQFDALERISKAIASTGFWRDGWVAARHTRQHAGKGLSAESLRRLVELEEFLRPKDLVNRVRGIVFGERGGNLDLDDFADDEAIDLMERLHRAALAVEQLGRDVAADEKSFATLLPELVAGSGRLRGFGVGLAQGVETPRNTWSALVAQVGSTDKPNLQVLGGFLEGLQARDPETPQALLDEAVEDPVLGKWLVELQASVTINEAGVRRLHRALELGKVHIRDFAWLVGGRVCDSIPGPAFRDLLVAIGAKPGGDPVALEILMMRLHSDNGAERIPSPETIQAGRILLGQLVFGPRQERADRNDYTLGVVAVNCLEGPEGAPIARKIWRSLRTAIQKYDIYSWEQDDLLQALFKTQPTAMLDELVKGSDKDRGKNIDIIRDTNRHHPNPVGFIPDDVLLAWCDADPALRYPFAAAAALLFDHPDGTASLEWRPITNALLKRSPDPAVVLMAMGETLWPMSFDGSLATELERRLHMLDRLDIGRESALATAFQRVRARLARAVDDERRRELEEDRMESGRFE
ncbi:hypothetical protein [Mesorhizobium sp. CA4]|uniref:hypothetical protein n=1 Tax=Mesorhizobium sp. CA4 TaxID=588499 RepID=UPI001CD15C9E|nr:hypothetical protein [Mesorhizobium sp. CA4]MBZ9823209.1 hypothetical protein [Mesorhizobium sp. CA4]